METKEPRVWSRRSTCRRVREREFLREIGDPRHSLFPEECRNSVAQANSKSEPLQNSTSESSAGQETSL